MLNKGSSEDSLSVLREILKLSDNDTLKRININDALVNASLSKKNSNEVVTFLSDMGYIKTVNIGGIVTITKKGIEEASEKSLAGEPSNNKTGFLSFILDLYRILKAKPENKISLLLVTTGLLFLNPPLITQLINIFLDYIMQDKMSPNYPIGWSLIMLGIIFFLVMKQIRAKNKRT